MMNRDCLAILYNIKKYLIKLLWWKKEFDGSPLLAIFSCVFDSHFARSKALNVWMLVYQKKWASSWDISLLNSKFIAGHDFGFVSCNTEYCLVLDDLQSFLIRFPVAVLERREGGRKRRRPYNSDLKHAFSIRWFGEEKLSSLKHCCQIGKSY